MADHPPPPDPPCVRRPTATSAPSSGRRAPEAGEALGLGLGSARSVGSVTVLQPAGSDALADIQLRGTDGTWRTVGALDGPYTRVNPAGRTADAVRLAWRAGSAAPQIAELVVG
ncbi:hypothetical protein [Streptomyces sp. NPDC048496]|uniref:hypothetical protein n=1 Tax=Streptomyces sp. NPDC048496 TaxID=3365558 RepID=UPI00370F940E